MPLQGPLIPRHDDTVGRIRRTYSVTRIKAISARVGASMAVETANVTGRSFDLTETPK